MSRKGPDHHFTEREREPPGRKRSEFLARYSNLGKSFASVPYHTKIIRRNGHLCVGLMLDAYRTEAITTSDASDYLGGHRETLLPGVGSRYAL